VRQGYRSFIDIQCGNVDTFSFGVEQRIGAELELRTIHFSSDRRSGEPGIRPDRHASDEECFRALLCMQRCALCSPSVSMFLAVL
jgi:hypothetical protein